MLIFALIPSVGIISEAQAACNGSYQIGFQGPLTGPEGYFGTSQLKAVKFALAKFKSANPNVAISGTVAAYDDQGDPAIAATLAPSIAANECLLGLVGPSFSGAAKATLYIYRSAGLPVITPSASNPDLSLFGQSIFHRNVILEKQIYLDMLSDIGAVAPNSTIGYFFSQGNVDPNALSNMSGIGGIQVLNYEQSDDNIQTTKTDILAAYNSGIRYFVYDFPYDEAHATGFATYLKTLPGTQLIFGPYYDLKLIPSIKAFVQGAWAYPMSYPIDVINPSLASEFKTSQNADSDIYSGQAFDAAMFFLEGIKSGANTRNALNSFITNKVFNGLTGPISFGADGDLVAKRSLKFVYANSAISLANLNEASANGDLTSSNKISKINNFQFKITESDASSVASTAYFHFPSYNWKVSSNSEVLNTSIPNGTTTFEIVSSEDPQGPISRKRTFQVKASNGQVTEVKDISVSNSPTTVNIVGDTYVLKFKDFNFVATVAGDDDYSDSIAAIFEKSLGGDLLKFKIPVRNMNKIYANLDSTKSYKIDFYPSGLNSKFDVTTWDNISFRGASSLAYSGVLTNSNVFGKINPYPSKGGSLKVLTKDGNGQFTIVAKQREVAANGTFGFQLTVGTKFKIYIEPFSNNNLGPNTSPEYTVPTTGSLTLNDISFLGSNVTGTITSSNTAVSGANFYVYLINGNDWIDTYSGQTNANGRLSLFLPIGTYKIYVDPSNVNYLLESKEIDCVVTTTSVPTSCNGSLSQKNISGNVSFDGVSASGRTITARGFSSTGGYITSDSSQITSESKFGLQGIADTTYEFIVNSSPSDANQTSIGLTSRNCATASTAKTCDISLQTNMKFQIADYAGNLLKGISTAILSSAFQAGDFYYNGQIFEAPYLNNYTKMSLPNGVFYLTTDDKHIDNWSIGYGVGNTYKVTVTSGSVSEVREVSTGTILQSTGGIYTLKTKQPNIKIKAVDDTTELKNSYIYIRDLKQQKIYHQSILNSNLHEFLLPDGSYEFQLDPYKSLPANKATGRYFVVIKDGLPISVTKSGSSENISTVSGYYIFTLGVPNVSGIITQGGSPLQTSVQFQKWNEVNGSWDWDAGKAVGADGVFTFNLSPGKYRSILYVNFNTSKGSIISGPICNVPQSGTVVCDQVVPSNSFVFTIKDSAGVIQKNGLWATLIKQGTSKSDVFPISINAVQSTGKFAAPLYDGTYDMTVSQRTDSGENSKSFTVTVINQEVTNVVDNATSTSMSKVGGIYDLAFFSPNIKGTFKNSDGTSLSFATNQSLSAELQIYENSNWNTVGNYWFSAANWQATISRAGKYRFKVNPQSMPNMSTSYSDVFYINSGRKASLNETTGFVDQLVGFDIRVLSNNFNYKVINPIDQLPLSSGWIWIFKQENDGKENYYADGYIYPGSAGIGGKYLAEGNYRLVLQPQNLPSLDKNEYLINVNSSGVVTVKESGVNVASIDNRYILKPTSANITGRTVSSNGTPVGQMSNSGVSIQAQKKNSNGGWDWISTGTNSDPDGYFGVRIKDIGVYRLVVNPWRKENVAQTYSSEFEITSANQSSFTKEFGNLALNAPNLKISVVTSDTGTALINTYVGILFTGSQSKENPWNIGLDTGESGIATAYIPGAGTYQIAIQPPGNGLVDGFVSKTYTATAVKDANGVISVSIDSGQGAAVVSGVTRLKLGSSNLRGIVTTTDGTTSVANSFVLPIQIIDGRSVERWDLGRSSDQNGKWSISLPSGTFKIKARGPYGSITLGSSATLATIVVDANGNISSLPTGKSALAFNIPLQAPTWSGVLKIPGSEDVATSASVCLNYKIDINSYSSDCSQVNQLGQWAITLPDGLTLDSDSQLYVYDYQNKYPQIRLIGKSAIEAVIGAGGSGKTLRFPSANINIAVTFAGAPVSNVNVNANRSNEWLGSVQTSDLGVVGFYSANIVDAFYASVGIYNNATALESRYVTTTTYFSAADIASGTTNGVFNGTLALNAPNVKGVVRKPSSTSTAGDISNNSYLNVYDVEKGEWVAWAQTALDGTFALYLKPGCCSAKEYTIVLEPGVDKFNPEAKQEFVRKEYKVMIGTNGVALITEKQTGNTVSTETLNNTLVARLTLGSPNISGSVVDPSGQVVQGIDVSGSANCGMFGCYTWSDSSGTFKLNLPDQTSVLQAGNWNSGGFVKSAECPITISGGVLTTPAGGCVQSNGTIKLALRTPNFTFTLKNSGTSITNAWVNFSIGNWWTYAPVDQNGKVSLFVDDAAVLAANGGQSGLTLTPHIYVDPYNSPEAVRWDCNAGSTKPICSSLTTYVTGQQWVNKALGDVQVVTSNIRIKSVRPDNNVGVRSSGYIEIFRIDHGYDEWVSWSQTDEAGFGNFYLDESNYSGAKFKVRVVPSWELRSTFATKVWDNSGSGYNFADLNNLSLAIAVSNLKLTVVSPSGSNPNKWGWVSLEKVDTTTSTISWVDGNTLDDFGVASFALKASTKYRITANPGSGRSGTATQCIIQTDSSTAITLVAGQCVGGSYSISTGLTLALARGNVIGSIYAEDGVTPLAGATIYANIVGATDESMAVVTCSLSDGTYGITLKEGYQWQIRVIPANYVDDPIKYQTKVVATPVTPNPGTSTTLNISLLRK